MPPERRSPLAKPTKTRRPTPRSKTGCLTCKIRRLKCGEEKPSCVRCTKSGWRCDGYAPASMTSSKSPLSSRLKIPNERSHNLTSPSSPASSFSHTLFPQPPQSSSASKMEQWYYQSFLDDFVNQLPTHEANFWRNIMLNHGTSCPSARLGIIAIAALAKSAPRRTWGGYVMDSMNSEQTAHREFALQKYQEAIVLLQSFLNDTVQQADRMRVQNSIWVCLTLAFFDTFIGDGGKVLGQIQDVKEVMIKGKMVFPTWSNPSADCSQRFWIMFLRLDMQSLATAGIHVKRTFLSLHPHTPSILLPATLSSLAETAEIRDSITWEADLFLYEAAQLQLSPHRQIPIGAINRRNYLIQHIQAFHTLLNTSALSTNDNHASHPLQSATSLKLTSTVALVRLTASLREPETVYDASFSQFKFLLDFCRTVVDFESISNLGLPEGETYTPTPQIIPALLLVATKCRNSSLRREAISHLLASHRREGMYDSFLAGQIGQWIMSLEEEGMNGSGYIPEEARVWGEVVEWTDYIDGFGDLSGLGLGKKVCVRARQNYLGEDGRRWWRWREKDIFW